MIKGLSAQPVQNPRFGRYATNTEAGDIRDMVKNSLGQSQADALQREFTYIQRVSRNPLTGFLKRDIELLNDTLDAAAKMVREGRENVKVSHFMWWSSSRPVARLFRSLNKQARKEKVATEGDMFLKKNAPVRIARISDRGVLYQIELSLDKLPESFILKHSADSGKK